MRPLRAIGRRLLIVDDNEAPSQLLAWTFEDLGYAVWRAADCCQAAEPARVHRIFSTLAGSV